MVESIIMTEMELCVFALLNTYSIKGMQRILPRNVNNKFKWKNGIYINKHKRLVIEKFRSKGIIECIEFQEMLSSLFYPEKMYVILEKEKIKLDIRISKHGNVTFEEIGEGLYKIERISNTKDVVNSIIGFDTCLFYENIICEMPYVEYKKVMRDFCRKQVIEEKQRTSCEISSRLEKPMWILEVHTANNVEKDVEVIVWNRKNDIIEFCITENYIEECEVKIGTINLRE